MGHLNSWCNSLINGIWRLEIFCILYYNQVVFITVSKDFVLHIPNYILVRWTQECIELQVSCLCKFVPEPGCVLIIWAFTSCRRHSWRKTIGNKTHFYFLYTLYFLFLTTSNLDYVDPQIAYLLFEAGQSSTNICYNILIKKIKN